MASKPLLTTHPFEAATVHRAFCSKDEVFTLLTAVDGASFQADAVCWCGSMVCLSCSLLSRDKDGCTLNVRVLPWYLACVQPWGFLGMKKPINTHVI